MIRRAGLVGAAIAVVVAFAPNATAQPAPQVTPIADEPIARANPQLSRAFIESLPPVVRASSVRIDSSVTADTTIIYPDGTLVPGQNAARARRVSCNGPYKFIYLIKKTPATSGCAVFGSPGLKMKYVWNSDAGPRGVPLNGCMAAEGHDDVGRVKWFFAGCGTSSGTTVPWGNNLAKPRVLPSSGTQGFRGLWSHFSKSSSAKCTTSTFQMPPSITKNAIRIKCPNVFVKMRAKAKIGSTVRYGKYVHANQWSTVVFAPGQKPTTIYAVK